MSASPEEMPQESPLERGIVWNIFQVLFQAFFCFWLGYRSWGHKRLDDEPGALILSNHQSFLDPLLVGLPLKRPISYLARENLFDVPLVGWILKKTHVLPINQEAAGTASLRKMVDRLKEGWLVGIFPEGTRSADGTIGEVKPGFATVVRRAKKPVIPVGVSGAYQAMPMGSWFVKPVRVRVVYGAPITIEELERYPDRNQEPALIELVRTRLIECYDAAEKWRTTGVLPDMPADKSPVN
jgi:1-acyl-sn-glycerol-3-phosphate acyltransferase